MPVPAPSRRRRTFSGRTTTSTGPRQAGIVDRDRSRAPCVARAPSLSPGQQVGVADERRDEPVARDACRTRSACRPAGSGPRPSPRRGRRGSAPLPGRGSRRPRSRPLGARMSRTSARTRPRSAASRFENGSSSRTIAGSGASARAIATRCCWPPESSCGRRPPLSGEADELEHLAHARRRVARVCGRRSRRCPPP